MCITAKYYWFNHGSLKDCRRPFWVPREHSPSFSDKIKTIADQQNNTWVFDTESLLCDGSGCSTHTEDNVRLYRDDQSHLSKWGQLLLSPHFAALLERLPDPPPLAAKKTQQNRQNGQDKEGGKKAEAPKAEVAEKPVKGQETGVAPALSSSTAADSVAVTPQAGAPTAAADPARPATAKPPRTVLSSS